MGIIGFADRAGGEKGFVDLLVELFAVGDDDEGPIAGFLAQDLLGEEEHGEGFAGALGVPEDAELALAIAELVHGIDGALDAEELVVLGDELDGAALDIGIDGEVLDEIEEASGIAGAADEGFEGDGGGFVFRCGATPFGEVLPFGGDGADARFVAVGEDDEGVVPEELGDGGLVVAQVVVDRRLWRVW